jgi:uncharacterized protein with PIN domain
MSVPEQKPPAEKSLADQRVQKILDQVAELQKQIKEQQEYFREQKIPSKTEKEEDPFEHVHSCPTCKAKLEKEIAEKALEETQKTLKERSLLPTVCEGCGLGVKPEEKECLACGSTKYKYRSH